MKKLDITIKDLEGWQARIIIKLADMMKASDERYTETSKSVGKIEEIINKDPLY